MEIMTEREVATKLGWTDKTLKHYLYTGHKIKPFFKKVGAKNMMTEEDFYKYVESCVRLGELRNG